MTTGEGEKWAANKELLIIPDAVHTDLYDNLDVIPFDKIEEFIRKAIDEYSYLLRHLLRIPRQRR